MRLILLASLALATIAAIGAADQAAAQSTTATGVSRAFNPAISVNALARAQASRDSDAADLNGFRLDGVEAQFSAIVDPFWKAEVIIGLHPEHADEDAEDAAHAHGMVTDVEAAYLDSRALPASLGLRVGRFVLPYGKHAPLHMHQYPFADAPAGVAAFLGEHMPIENGARLAWPAPLPWYADLQVYGVSGDGAAFDASSRDLAYGARLENLWDLGDESTLEVSGSFLHGPDGRHPGEGLNVDLPGVDVTWKWIDSTRSRGPALTVTAEVLLPDYEEGPDSPLGWYGLAQYRFHRNWWLGVGAGRAYMAHGDEHDEEAEADAHDHGFAGDVREVKLNLTFAPSEFSFVRAEVGYWEDVMHGTDDLRVLIQFNATIGSHPAHQY